MKTRYCRRCGAPITNSAHALYCPTCRKIVTQERISARREAYNAYRRKRYAEKKKMAELQQETPPENVCVTSASERYRRMSLREVSAECARLHLTYGQVQVMAERGTLPKDFGLGVN